MGAPYKPTQIHQRPTNAAGNIPNSNKALLDDDKYCGAKIYNKIIQWANDNSCGEATPDDNREQPSETDTDDNEDEDEVDNNNNNDREKDGTKKAAPLQKVAIHLQSNTKKIPLCG